MTIRKATLADIELLIRLRLDYLTAEKGEMTHEEEIKSQLKKYFAKHIPQNTFVGILAEENGRVVSVAYLMLFEKPANQMFLTGVTATIFNVLTYPEYRRKGFAAQVIRVAIKEVEAAGASRVDLSATPEGKFLYEKLGFKKSKYTEMYLPLKTERGLVT